jgi:hypothetical protein
MKRGEAVGGGCGSLASDESIPPADRPLLYLSTPALPRSPDTPKPHGAHAEVARLNAETDSYKNTEDESHAH